MLMATTRVAATTEAAMATRDRWARRRTCPFSRLFGSESPQDRDDLAEDDDLVGVELHRLQARIGRSEDDLVALAAVVLDRRLLAGDARNDDVALLAGVLTAHRHVV